MQKVLSIFTTATATGVSVRYVTAMLSAVITLLGLLGVLDDEQQKALIDAIPGLLAAITALIALLLPIYAIITKSSSDKGAEAAKATDTLPKSLPVTVKAEGHEPIKIQPK